MIVDSSCSFLRFYYPFSFSPKTFGARIQAIQNAAWPKRDGNSLPLWEQDSFPKGDLLPSVRDFVNPPTEAEIKANPGRSGASGWLFRLKHNVTQSPDGLLLRNCRWSLELPDRSLEFTLGGGVPDSPAASSPVELALFSSGTGCLCFHVGLNSTEPADWLAALHFLRFAGIDLKGAVQRGGRTHLKLEKMIRKDGETTVENYWPANAPLVEAPKRPAGSGTLGDIIHALLASAAIPGKPLWTEDVFVPGRMLTFASLYPDGGDEAEQLKLLHAVRGCYRLDQQPNPEPTELRWDHPTLLPYAKGQYFATTIEGFAFVAFDAPPLGSKGAEAFFRGELPRHLASDYSFIYLMALHQRFALLRFQAEAARWHEEGVNEEEKSRRYQELQAHFQRFTARCHFLQVMQRDHHHRVYAAMLKAFQIQELYGEVRAGLADLHDFYTRRQEDEEAAREDKFQQIVGFIAFIVGMPTIVSAVVGVFGGTKVIALELSQALPSGYINPTDEVDLARISGGIYLIGLMIGALMFVAFRWWSARRANSRQSRN